jgi:hypothetical protein
LACRNTAQPHASIEKRTYADYTDLRGSAMEGFPGAQFKAMADAADEVVSAATQKRLVDNSHIEPGAPICGPGHSSHFPLKSPHSDCRSGLSVAANQSRNEFNCYAYFDNA